VFEVPDTTFDTSGPKIRLPCNSESTPLELVRLFLTDSIVENICQETNRYSQQLIQKGAKLQKSTPLTVDEYWRFQGLVLLIGIVKKPTIPEYWSQSLILSTPIFSQTMSRNR